MDKADVQDAFVKAGLSRVLKDLDTLLKPSIRLTTRIVDESTIAVGASKLGGLPDLPAGTPWPTWQGLPQSFIAQIRLEDVRQYDVEKVLPQSGMLWFFYDAKQETYGDDPANRGGWAVLYDQSSPALQRTSAPASLPAGSRFRACAVTFATEVTLAQNPQLEIAQCDWSDEEQQKYEQILSAFPDAADRAKAQHHLLGFPDTIQDDMREQCQLVAHGVTDSDDPRAQQLAQGTMAWRLLLQVDTEEPVGMRWASSGMLYYWIQQVDLQARRFANTWVVLQSE